MTLYTQAKRVSFGNVSERDATERHSFSEEQMESMWYNQDELKAIRRQLKRIVNRKVAMDTTQDCWRGLEAFVNSSRTSRYEKSIQPILKLIWDSEDAGVSDPTGVQSFAVCLNRKSTEDGIKRASQDFVDAYEIYRETMDGKHVDSCHGKINTTRAVPRSKNATARTA